MVTLRVIIERADNNYSAYIDGVNGITVTGSTIDEIKKNMITAIGVFIEECSELGCELPDALKGDYELSFKMDIKSFLYFQKPDWNVLRGLIRNNYGITLLAIEFHVKSKI